jgi:hypothetical protein
MNLLREKGRTGSAIAAPGAALVAANESIRGHADRGGGRKLSTSAPSTTSLRMKPAVNNEPTKPFQESACQYVKKKIHLVNQKGKQMSFSKRTSTMHIGAASHVGQHSLLDGQNFTNVIGTPTIRRRALGSNMRLKMRQEYKNEVKRRRK